MFRDLERGQEPFIGIAAHRIFEASLSTDAQARRASGVLVSGSYFQVLGLEPALGRLLGPQDDRIDGVAESVVLSHAYWQNEFGADPDVIGSTLTVNGRPLTIVGVAPRGFHGATIGTRASVFVPITIRWLDLPQAIPNHDRRDYYWVSLFARLRPGVGREEAAAAVDPLYRTLLNELEVPLHADVEAQELEQFRTKPLVLEPGAHGQGLGRASLGERLEMLFTVSAIVLILCCANIAALMLVRSAVRRGEIAVRASIGASRGRLAAMLTTESLLLALPAGIASPPVALLTMRGIRSGMPGLPSAAFDVEVSVAAALVGVGTALVSALVFGLAPVSSVMRAEPAKSLQDHGLRQTSSKGVTRFRATLATAQIALSMALLATTGLLAHSLVNISRVDLGLDPESVVTFSISPELSGYSPEASARLFDRLEEALAAIPGVASAASSRVALLSRSVTGMGASVGEGDASIQGMTYFNSVGPGFFRTLGMQLLSGREFNDADAFGAPNVAIVNQRFAELFRLGRDVVGRRITVAGTDAVIVGLVADARYEGVTSEIEPQAFLPRRQSTTLGSASFYIRSERPTADLMNAVRETAARVDPRVPIAGLRTMEQVIRENLRTERYAAGASIALAVLATVLAGLGLYGVLAYGVAQRSREIGLRFALGAPAGRIRRMVLRQVAAMASAGVLLGVAVAWLLGRTARSLLFGVEAGDPVALLAAAAVLAAVTLGAAYVPARRASRVDPMIVLRYE